MTADLHTHSSVFATPTPEVLTKNHDSSVHSCSTQQMSSKSPPVNSPTSNNSDSSASLASTNASSDGSATDANASTPTMTAIAEASSPQSRTAAGEKPPTPQPAQQRVVSSPTARRPSLVVGGAAHSPRRAASLNDAPPGLRQSQSFHDDATHSHPPVFDTRSASYPTRSNSAAAAARNESSPMLSRPDISPILGSAGHIWKTAPNSTGHIGRFEPPTLSPYSAPEFFDDVVAERRFSRDSSSFDRPPPLRLPAATSSLAHGERRGPHDHLDESQFSLFSSSLDGANGAAKPRSSTPGAMSSRSDARFSSPYGGGAMTDSQLRRFSLPPNPAMSNSSYDRAAALSNGHGPHSNPTSKPRLLPPRSRSVTYDHSRPLVQDMSRPHPSHLSRAMLHGIHEDLPTSFYSSRYRTRGMQVMESPRNARGERQIPPQSAPSRSTAQAQRRYLAESEQRFAGAAAARRSLFSQRGPNAGEADFPPAFATPSHAAAGENDADFFGASERLIVFGLPANMANPVSVERFVQDYAPNNVSEPEWHVDEYGSLQIKLVFSSVRDAEAALHAVNDRWVAPVVAKFDHSLGGLSDAHVESLLPTDMSGARARVSPRHAAGAPFGTDRPSASEFASAPATMTRPRGGSHPGQLGHLTSALEGLRVGDNGRRSASPGLRRSESAMAMPGGGRFPRYQSATQDFGRSNMRQILSPSIDPAPPSTGSRRSSSSVASAALAAAARSSAAAADEEVAVLSSNLLHRQHSAPLSAGSNSRSQNMAAARNGTPVARVQTMHHKLPRSRTPSAPSLSSNEDARPLRCTTAPPSQQQQLQEQQQAGNGSPRAARGARAPSLPSQSMAAMVAAAQRGPAKGSAAQRFAATRQPPMAQHMIPRGSAPATMIAARRNAQTLAAVQQQLGVVASSPYNGGNNEGAAANGATGDRHPFDASLDAAASKSDEESLLPPCNYPPNARTRVLTVSYRTSIRSIAGAIAHTTRKNQYPLVLASGPEGVNLAMKAIAIAREYLDEDQTDISCTCEESNEYGGFRFPVFSNQGAGAKPRGNTAPITEDEAKNMENGRNLLKVSKYSDAYKLAGAITKEIRDTGRASVGSMGSMSVFQAVKAITIAKEFLREDYPHISVHPEFMSLLIGDGGTEKRSVLRMVVIGRPMNVAKVRIPSTVMPTAAASPSVNVAAAALTAAEKNALAASAMYGRLPSPMSAAAVRN